jgi:dipeptidyl aminopeptidase/acylaminoacyl peptidase
MADGQQKSIDALSRAFTLPVHFLNVARRFIMFGTDYHECERVLSQIASMEEWTQRWTESASRFEGKGYRALEMHQPATAKTMFKQAYLSYRLAGFPILQDTEQRRELYVLHKETFRQMALLDTFKTDFIQVPYEGHELPGYIVLPGGQGPWPVLVYLTGADGWKEDQYFIAARRAAERGMACVVIDGPGQGEGIAVHHLSARYDYEVVVAVILDFLQTLEYLDMASVGIMGSSASGYYAPRVAAFEKRIKACAVLSALYDVVEGVFDVYPPIRSRLAEIVGTDSLDEARRRFAAFTLKGVAGRIECPCLIVHGECDQIIPVSEAQRLYGALNCPKELRIWEGANHNCDNFDIESKAFMFDWLRERLV